MILSYVKLGFAALLVVLCSFVLFKLDQSRFLKKRYAVKQVLFGILFGGLAVLGTEWGIPFHGAQANCRDAAVLCAGLLFGGPAGVTAGLIGGVERWVAVAWGVGTYTRVACSISTILAGVFAALLRKYLFENKRPGGLLAFAVGVVMEVFHLTMVFITNMNEPVQAMNVVQACAVPMIVANGVSVALAAMLLTVVSPDWKTQRRDQVHISQTVQRLLMVTVLVAFALTSYFVFSLQDTLAVVQAEQMLKRVNQEIVDDISDASDENLLELTYKAVTMRDKWSLVGVARKYGLAEVSLIDENGIIVDSSEKEYIGFDMHTGEQSAAFLCLLDDDTTEYVQGYGPIARDSSIMRKYAGVKLDEGFLQAGYDAVEFQNDIARLVQGATTNRHVGETGYCIIYNAYGKIVSAPEGLDVKELKLGEPRPVGRGTDPNTVRMTVNGEECIANSVEAEGFRILSVISTTEAMQLRSVAMYVNTFMEILVFALLFALIYIIIQRVVVKRIKQINRSLACITGGNLNEVVNVRTSEEFASLSDDINSTVDTLKRYIAEASARLDQELEVARNIQASSLPHVAPNFSGRSDLDLHAFMDPAKEVGGDFYDFYLTDGEWLNFVVADVSGKGIPGAMFMMRAMTELKNLATAGMELQEAFIHGNRDLCSGNDAGMFVTAWQGRLNLSTGDLQFVNAGHNHPLVRRSDGHFEMLKTRANFILGGMDTARYRRQDMKLEKGDVLFLYTDGVTEATNANNELYGDDRLLAVANAQEYATMEEMCTAVKADVDRFVGDAPQFDDITMLALRYLGREADWNMHFDEAALEDIPEITEKAEEELDRLGCSMKVTTAMCVAIDEIYSNIVKFAYPGKKGFASVSIHLDENPRSVALIFEDAGLPYNPLTTAAPDTSLSAEERKIGGLGIHIVRKTMDEVQYRYENDRNIFTIRKNL